jgi:hypothetical protein
MALIAPKNGPKTNFPPQENMEPGTYPARLVQVLDLGLQPQRPYKGEDKPPANEIMLTYEFVDVFMKDEEGNDLEDKPRWLSETLPFYGLFADKAKSTQRYYAFDPNEELGGDFAKLIGMPINITVVNNQVGDKKYDNIANATPMRAKDAAKCPELKNPTKVFDIDNPDMAVFAALPKWIQDKMKGNLRYEASALQKLVDAGGGKRQEKAPAKVEKEVVNADDDSSNPY